MADFIETEAKYHVASLAPVQAQLERQKAVLSAPRVLERNLRYDSADGAISQRNVVLRLRQDARVRLTYKEDLPAAPPGPLSRYEAEVEVDDFEAMDAILKRLGYVELLVYEKYRTTYTLAGVEVTLDELPFGTFVEIEGERDSIEHVAGLLGLDPLDAVSASYTTIFERVRQLMHLPFRDLTFEQFAGITVPDSVLIGR